MGLFTKLRARTAKMLAGNSPYVQNFLNGMWADAGRQTSAGVRVNEEVALTYSAVWAATRLLTEPPAMMPLKLYQRRADGGKDEQTTHPLYQVLHDAPNPEMSSQSFRETVGEWAVNWGMGYAEIQRIGTSVEALWPIHPSRVTPQRNDNKKILWEVRNDVGPPTFIPDDDMFYVPGALSEDGIMGKGIIRQAREVIGWGLGTQMYGETFFGNGAKPSGILTTPNAIDADMRQKYRQEWIKGHGGPMKANKIAFLDNGLTYTPMSVPNEDAQFIETMQFQITEIARWYNIPPHMLQELTRATFNNIEEMGAGFVRYSLLPWLKRWEHQIRRKLLTPQDRADGMFAEFGVEGLLRGDIKTRYETYATGRQWGWFSVNDIRKLENLNPIPDGESYLVPGNMLPAEDVGKLMDDKPPAKSDDDESQLQSWLLSRMDKLMEQQTDDVNTFRELVPSIAQQIESLQDGKRPNMQHVLSAIEPLLVHTLDRLMVRESKKVAHMASDAVKFWDWLSDDEFYDKHSTLMADTLRPVVDTLTMLAHDGHLSQKVINAIVPGHIEMSRYELLDMTGKVRKDELQAGVGLMLAAWKDRAAAETKIILDIFRGQE